MLKRSRTGGEDHRCERRPHGIGRIEVKPEPDHRHDDGATARSQKTTHDPCQQSGNQICYVQHTNLLSPEYYFLCDPYSPSPYTLPVAAGVIAQSPLLFKRYRLLCACQP